MNNNNIKYNIDESLPMMMALCGKLMAETLKTKFNAANINVTTDQWVTLLYLWEQDGLTQQDLANRYGRSKVSVFHMLKRLEKLGLVMRRPDPVDGRSNRVYLTQEGRKLESILVPIGQDNIAEMTSDLSNEEVNQLKLAIRTIIKKLRKMQGLTKEAIGIR